MKPLRLLLFVVECVVIAIGWIYVLHWPLWTYTLVLLSIPLTGIACAGVGWLILRWRQRRDD